MVYRSSTCGDVQCWYQYKSSTGRMFINTNWPIHTWAQLHLHKKPTRYHAGRFYLEMHPCNLCGNCKAKETSWGIPFKNTILDARCLVLKLFWKLYILGLFAPCLQDLEARPVECRIDAQHLFMLPAGWDVREMYILRNNTIKFFSFNWLFPVKKLEICFKGLAWVSVAYKWTNFLAFETIGISIP